MKTTCCPGVSFCDKLCFTSDDTNAMTNNKYISAGWRKNWNLEDFSNSIIG